MAEETMTLEDVGKKLGTLEKDLTEATKRADHAEAVIKLSSEDRAAYDSLPVEKQQEFLDGDESVRKAMTPVVDKKKKTNAGAEGAGAGEGDGKAEPDEDDMVGKSAKFVDLEKKYEDLSKQLTTAQAQAAAAETIAKSEREARQTVEFEKKAESDYPALPGTAVEKGKVLRVIAAKMSAEEAAEVHKLLVAGNEAMKQMTVAKGSDAAIGKAGEASAWAKIETLAKAEVAKSAGKMTIEKAVQLVMKNEPKLYEDYLTAQEKQ